MRSDILAAGFALVLFAIRLIVLSLQGLMSQTNVAICFGMAICVCAAIRPSTDVIADLGYIRTWSNSRLVKVKREEQPNVYAFILIVSWMAAIALAIFMFSVDLSGMEFTRVKWDISSASNKLASNIYTTRAKARSPWSCPVCLCIKPKGRLRCIFFGYLEACCRRFWGE